jgi:hypothetical protein
MQSTRYSCRILMDLVFARQIFEKSLKFKFLQHPVGVELFPSGMTDGQTDVSEIIKNNNNNRSLSCIMTYL